MWQIITIRGSVSTIRGSALSEVQHYPRFNTIRGSLSEVHTIRGSALSEVLHYPMFSTIRGSALSEVLHYPRFSNIRGSTLSEFSVLRALGLKKASKIDLFQNLHFWIFSKHSFRNELHSPHTLYPILLPNTPYVKFWFFFVVFVWGL